jgi:hypothetical protein
MSAVSIPPDATAVAEVAALTRELVGAITRQIDWYVTQLGMTPPEAGARARSLGGEAIEAAPADKLTWAQIETVLEGDPARAMAVWTRLKDEAEHELMTGVTAGRALKVRLNNRPVDRARYLAILRALTTSMGPRDAVETLVIQQVAMAYDRTLYWQTLATHRLEEEEWEGDRDRRRTLEQMSGRERERWEEDHGWMPPRVSTAEAIEQAVLMADRYQRSFLRLLKALRDQRRMVGTLVVTGGQVNVAEQQINVTRQY